MNSTIRKDVVKMNINDKDYLLVYHKDIDIGFGSTVAFYKNHKNKIIEFLKYDCFGKTHGHYHSVLKTKDRIYFTEETVEEQINVACNKLMKIGISKNILDEVKELMIDYENKYYKHLRKLN